MIALQNDENGTFADEKGLLLFGPSGSGVLCLTISTQPNWLKTYRNRHG
jgi:hypothetical protein